MACVPAHRRGRTVTSILRVGTKGNTVCSDPAGLALLMVSVPCVPKSAASCLDSRSLTPSHCQGPRPYSGSSPEGGACSPKWAGLGRARLVLFLHKGSALHPLQVKRQEPCRGRSSESPPGWELSAPGICEEGRREFSMLSGSCF